MSNTIDEKDYQPAEYYIGERYKEYLLTIHWFRLKEKYILQNPKARCWICETPVFVFERFGQLSSNLLLHHVRYDNLFHERLYRDLFILCISCHSQVHFSTYFKIFRHKTQLTRMRLYRKMVLLRIRFCIRFGKFWLVPWYMLRYLTL
jgi:hypothetical protein